MDGEIGLSEPSKGQLGQGCGGQILKARRLIPRNSSARGGGGEFKRADAKW